MNEDRNEEQNNSQPTEGENSAPGGQAPVHEPASEGGVGAEETKSPVGPLVGIILIIVIIVLGAIFFWTQEDIEAPVVEEQDEAADEESAEDVLQRELDELDEELDIDEELDRIDQEFEE